MRLNARPITARRRLAMSYGVVSIPPPFPPSLCFSRSLYFSSFEIVMLVCFLLDIPSTSRPFSLGHIVYALRYHQRFLLDARLSSSSLDSLPPPSLFYLPCLLSSTESYSHFFFGRFIEEALFDSHPTTPSSLVFCSLIASQFFPFSFRLADLSRPQTSKDDCCVVGGLFSFNGQLHRNYCFYVSLTPWLAKDWMTPVKSEIPARPPAVSRPVRTHHHIFGMMAQMFKNIHLYPCLGWQSWKGKKKDKDTLCALMQYIEIDMLFKQKGNEVLLPLLTMPVWIGNLFWNS